MLVDERRLCVRTNFVKENKIIHREDKGKYKSILDVPVDHNPQSHSKVLSSPSEVVQWKTTALHIDIV